MSLPVIDLDQFDFDRYQDEVTTEAWVDVLRQGRRLGALQLGFSGGEPVQRQDLEELVGEASRIGYYTNLITSGVGLTTDRLAALRQAGLKQIQLSLQACDAELNKRLVGVDVYQQKLACARAIKEQGFPMVLNVPVSRYNIEQAPALLAFAEELGIEYVEFANLQYYNWALINRAELMPTREQIAEAEAVVAETRARLGQRMTIYFVIWDYYDTRPKACMKGWGNIHLTIAPDGAASPPPCRRRRHRRAIPRPPWGSLSPILSALPPASIATVAWWRSFRSAASDLPRSAPFAWAPAGLRRWHERFAISRACPGRHFRSGSISRAVLGSATPRLWPNTEP